VNIDNTTHNPGAGWRLLGELELPAGASVEDALHAWLTEILHPLNLQAELVNKIIASAQDAVARAIRTDTMPRFEHHSSHGICSFSAGGEETSLGFLSTRKDRGHERGTGWRRSRC
jgi:hypothetical protein